MKKCNHKFESEDGKCVKCKKTLIQLWLSSMDEDVVSVNSESINEWENNNGRGFWGN